MTARMILLAGAAFAALVGSAAAADYDIPWYEAHPAERSDALRRCHNDFRLAQTPECANAEAAAIGAWGAQHKAFVPFKSFDPPTTPIPMPAPVAPPVTTGGDRAA